MIGAGIYTKDADNHCRPVIFEDLARLAENGTAVTRPQAGVSAEAVAKLVEKWREQKIGLSEAMKCTPDDLLNRCADELESALATAPPEQAAQTTEQLQAELQRVYKLADYWHGEAQRLERESEKLVEKWRGEYRNLTVNYPPSELARVFKECTDELEATLRHSQSAGPHIHSEAYGVTKDQCPACIAESKK